MNKLTAYQKYLIANATLITASRLIFQKLEQSQIQTHRLSEIAETTSGGTPSRTVSRYYGGNIPWIKSGELNDGVVEQAEEFITEEGLKDSSAKIYPQGTLVIALYGATVGKIGILGIDAASNQAVCAITPITNKVNTNFLFWFLRSKRQDFLKNSFGGAQPNISQKIIRETILPIPEQRLQQNICEFLEIIERRQNGEKNLQLPELPPPLEEQRRIVARVEELAGKFEEVRSLRQKALEEAEALITRAIATILDNDEWEELPLNKLLRENSLNGLSPRPSEMPPGLPILRISAATSQADAIIDEEDFKYLEVSEQDAVKYKLEPGDLLACRYNGNLHYTGKFALYKAYSGKQHLYPDKLIRFRVDTNNIMPEFARIALNSPKCRKMIESFCATTAGNIGLSAGNLKTVPVPVPPLPEQRRIVAYLDQLQSKVGAMKRLREEAMKELDALLPSILDKAFKGEL